MASSFKSPSKPFSNLLRKRVILAFFIASFASMLATGLLTFGFIYYLLGHSATLTDLLNYKVSILAIPSFILFFILFFYFIVVKLTRPFIAKNLVNPLNQLVDDIARLRLDEDQTDAVPHFQVKEVEDIYNALNKHIQSFQSMYDKFDSLKLTEHKTGLLRRAHLDDTLRHETFLARRFNRPFSVMVVRLKKLLDPTHSNNENLQAFTHELKVSTRNNDMLFYVNDHLFILVAPQTDCKEIDTLAAELSVRMRQAHKGETEFVCDFEVGCATYGEGDGLTPNALLHTAMRNLAESTPLSS